MVSTKVKNSVKDVFEMFLQDIHVNVIASKVGVHPRTIYKWKKKYNFVEKRKALLREAAENVVSAVDTSSKSVEVFVESFDDEVSVPEDIVEFKFHDICTIHAVSTSKFGYVLTSEDLGTLLGYKNPKNSVAVLLNRNPDLKNCLVNIKVKSGGQDGELPRTTVLSVWTEKGIYEACILAKTSMGKVVRKWVAEEVFNHRTQSVDVSVTSILDRQQKLMEVLAETISGLDNKISLASAAIQSHATAVDSKLALVEATVNSMGEQFSSIEQLKREFLDNKADKVYLRSKQQRIQAEARKIASVLRDRKMSKKGWVRENDDAVVAGTHDPSLIVISSAKYNNIFAEYIQTVYRKIHFVCGVAKYTDIFTTNQLKKAFDAIDSLKEDYQIDEPLRLSEDLFVEELG
jgi:prophage antirepressor-like protein